MSDQPNLLPDPAVTLGKLSLSCRAVLSARRIIPASLCGPGDQPDQGDLEHPEWGQGAGTGDEVEGVRRAGTPDN